MNKKVIFFIFLILFIITLVLSIRISYARYVLNVESTPITITTTSYSNLVIANINPVDGEDDTYNITVSNSNNCNVNFNVSAYNQNDSSQNFNVTMHNSQTLINGTHYWTVPANDAVIVKVTINRISGVDYTTSESGNSLIIPVAVCVNGISPYIVDAVINNSSIALAGGEIVVYDISYDANGGTGTTESQTGIRLDEDVVLRNNGFTKTLTLSFDANGGYTSVGSRSQNCTFNGWRYNGTNYSEGQTVRNLLTTAGTAVMSARWSDATIRLPSASRSDYDFLGWYTKRSGGSYVGGYNSYYSIGIDDTLYAHWSYNPPYVTLEYYANGGSNEPASENYSRGDDAYITSAKPTRSGYKFLFWTKDTSNITSQQYYAGDSIYMGSDRTLYAQWAPNNTNETYTVSFTKVCEEMSVPAPKSYKFGTVITLPTGTFDYNDRSYYIGSWDADPYEFYGPGDQYTVVDDVEFYPHIYGEDGSELIF